MWRTNLNRAVKGVCSRRTGCRRCTNQSGSKPDAAKAQTAKPIQPTPPPTESVQAAPKKGGGIFFKLLGLTTLGTGGVIGYSWYDPSFKKTLEDNVPYSKEAFEALFQYLPPAEKETIPLSSGAGIPKPPSTPKPVEEIPSKLRIPATQETAAEKKQRERQQIQDALKEKELSEASQNSDLQKILTDSVKQAVEMANEAVHAQKKATEATRSHSKQLKKAMDDADLAQKEFEWESVATAFNIKKDAIDMAESVTSTARSHVAQLQDAIKQGKANQVTKKNRAILTAEETMNQLSYDLNSSAAETAKAQSEVQLMKHYRDLVKKGREQFKNELKSIMPDVKIANRIGGKLTEDELNSLIAHAHRRIDQLQKHLAEQMVLEQQRLNEALQKQSEEHGLQAEAKVFREQERMRAQFEIEKQRLATEAGVQFEQDLRQQLARQAAAHSDHLAEVLKIQDAELNKKYEGLLHEQVIAERDRLRGEIAKDIVRLRAIEQAIDGRAELEKQGRKAQELWLACQSFINAIYNSKSGESTSKPLTSEINAIKEAGNNHPFVNNVIDSIPEVATLQGVQNPDALVDRFMQVRKVCKRVAMVDDTGGDMIHYFLSYLQSLLVFSRSKILSETEEVDKNDLNTFVLLDNAAHCLEKGDIEQAVKYVNQLSGQPRKVASDWLKDARLLLETKQAAEVLLAHAAASGLGSLF